MWARGMKQRGARRWDSHERWRLRQHAPCSRDRDERPRARLLVLLLLLVILQGYHEVRFRRDISLTNSSVTWPSCGMGMVDLIADERLRKRATCRRRVPRARGQRHRVECDSCIRRVQDSCGRRHGITLVSREDGHTRSSARLNAPP